MLTLPRLMQAQEEGAGPHHGVQGRCWQVSKCRQRHALRGDKEDNFCSQVHTLQYRTGHHRREILPPGTLRTIARMDRQSTEDGPSSATKQATQTILCFLTATNCPWPLPTPPAPAPNSPVGRSS